MLNSNILKDEKSDKAVKKTMLFAGIGIGIIIVCLILAMLSAKKLGKWVLKTIVDPIHEIDNAMSHFSAGDFSVQSGIEWKGDFIGILG